jgi:uncharacterized protein YpmS
VIVKLALLIIVAVAAGAGWMSGIGRSVTPATPATSAAIAAAPGDQTIEITEAELNQRLNQKLVGQSLGNTPMGAATLQDIKTTLADGHVVANGDAQVGSATVPVSLTASGSVQNGRAIVTVDDLRAASIPLPTSTRDSVQQALQAQVDDAVSQQGLRVSSISIDKGKLTLRGTHR